MLSTLLPGKFLESLASGRLSLAGAHLSNAMPKRKVVQKSIKNFCKKDEDEAKEGDNVDVAEETAKKPKRAKLSEKDKAKATGKQSQQKIVAPPMNRTDTDYSTINFDCDKSSGEGKSWNFKISSWNIVSLRALVKKNGFDYVTKESPDIMCLQETKCSEKNAPEVAKPSGYHKYFLSGEKEGYAGVALYSKQKPIKVEYGIGVKEFDLEGRVITAEYPKFHLVNAYVPNAGQQLVSLPKRMKWDPLFRSYLKKLDEIKPVILCGDLNVAHNEIDLKNPTTNTRSAGFTKEERDGFTALLNEGFTDTFRHFYPDKTGAYTYWSYRGNARKSNTGWRLDYFVVSKRFMSAICDNVIRKDVYGSDHCPITLFVSL